jgi:hypothetical protein
MIKMIRDVLEEQDPDVIILQLLHSSVYFARAADGWLLSSWTASGT